MIRGLIRNAFKAGAALLLLAASSLFIAGFVAVGFGSFLLTWPFVWGSPTRRRMKASVNLASAVLQLVSTMPSPQVSKMAQQAAMAAFQGEGEGDAPPIRE
jgi:hypothetical protein